MIGSVGTGTYEEALAWLEYCNGTGDTQSVLWSTPSEKLTRLVGQIFDVRIRVVTNHMPSSIGV